MAYRRTGFFAILGSFAMVIALTLGAMPAASMSDCPSAEFMSADILPKQSFALDSKCLAPEPLHVQERKRHLIKPTSDLEVLQRRQYAEHRIPVGEVRPLYAARNV